MDLLFSLALVLVGIVLLVVGIQAYQNRNR